MRVTVVPMGRPDAASLRMLAEDLAEASFDAALSEGEPPPRPAYDPARRQYRADAFLDALRRHPGDRVLGVTDLDLYVNGLNFVFGLAETRGRMALISLAPGRRRRCGHGGGPRAEGGRA
jgi:archaemetzincin